MSKMNQDEEEVSQCRFPLHPVHRVYFPVNPASESRPRHLSSHIADAAALAPPQTPLYRMRNL